MKARVRPLNATLRKLRLQPFTSAELEHLQAMLVRMEAEVERLGARAALERADVDRIERPLVRVALWLAGQLQAREAREREELERAIAATLEVGQAAQALRSWLVRFEPAWLSDRRAAADLERVTAEDLLELPEHGPELAAVHARALGAREAVAIAALCKQLAVRMGVRHGPTVPELRGGVARLRSRLERAGRADLADGLRRLPSEDVHRDLEVLYAVRSALLREAREQRDGLSEALRTVIWTRMEGRPHGLEDLLRAPAQG